MQTGKSAAILLAIALLFLVANHSAYRSWFQDDELDNLATAREIPVSEFGKGLLTPHYYPNNFRPIGHLFFWILERTSGLYFSPYIAAVQVLALLNIVLLWLFLRQLAIPLLPSAATLVFFAFHAALFDVIWKPMYVFDLLCGTFTLCCLLAWARRRIALALLSFWLAFRAKELAIALPVVLLVMEYLLGSKRWKWLLPFFLVSIYFGVRALLFNEIRHTDYTLRFDAQSVLTCLQFYMGELFLLPFAGFVLIALIAIRDRRVWFGLTMFTLMLAPMLFLPTRLFSAYLYVPLIGITVALAAASEHIPAPAVALLLAAWAPWDAIHLKQERRATLTQSMENRFFFEALSSLNKVHPELRTVLYRNAPMHSWGVVASERLLHPGQPVEVHEIDSPDAAPFTHASPLALIRWDSNAHQLHSIVRTSQTPLLSFISLDDSTPVWQLGKGWFGAENTFRWIAPEANAQLRRPPGAVRFELTSNVGDALIQHNGHSLVTVLLNGQSIGIKDFRQASIETVSWPVPAGAPGPVEVTIRAEPPFQSPDGRTLGIGIMRFGFANEGSAPR